jgi:REP element-mobilizing transposase RayT
MPSTTGFSSPRRYNSLRLLGFDYTSASALCFVTINTVSSRPVFGDINLAKATLAVMLNERTMARVRLYAYTLMPDHLHILAGVKEDGKSLSSLLGLFKSLTTQIYWKRGREVVEEQKVCLPATSFQKSERDQEKNLLQALIEWRATLRPEAVDLKNWPRVRPEHFLGKHLWHRSFNDHIIRNDADLRETIKYIAMNPVKRGYVSKPQFYPFTGFVLVEEAKT